MKILSASQIRQADSFTIKNEPIASVDLMERAARELYHWFHNNIKRTQTIAIFCGCSNNGGDGLALARMLHQTGYSVRAILVKHSERTSPDYNVNLQRLKQLNINFIEIVDVVEAEFLQADVVVDAIIGYGLQGQLSFFLTRLAKQYNLANALKIAIDIPTGLFAENNAKQNDNIIFKADTTLTFQSPKRSFMFSDFGQYVGNFKVLDIGLNQSFIANLPSDHFYIDEHFVKPLLLKREKFNHKGTFGHAAIVAGSIGKVGAAILSTKAALKSGAGLVTAIVPQCGLNPLQSVAPEIMVGKCHGVHFTEEILLDINPTAIGIGPGLSTEKSTATCVLDFIKNQNKPLVIDADALNILSAHKDWSILPKNSILTPHFGELDRMLDHTYRGEEVQELVTHFCKTHQVIVVLKGAHTAVYCPIGRVYFNSTGTNGMATAGSGDVLTGVITGLLAQNYSALNAAIIGVYYHGLAGQLASCKKGNRAMIASDIIENFHIPD